MTMTEQETTETNGAHPPAAPNVIQALARVMAELPGIGKDDRSEQGYQYRGIESITRHVQHLLGRHGVVFVPRVVSRNIKELTINGRPWTEDHAEVIYRVYGPGGAEDYIEVGPLWGLGRDNSDKGMNKAMTQAFKYALTQTLCVGDGKDDPDRDVAHEADAAPAPADPHREARNAIGLRIRQLSPANRDRVRAWCDEHKVARVPAQWTDETLAEVEELVDVLVQQAAAEPPQAGGEPVADPETGEVLPEPAQAILGDPGPSEGEERDTEEAEVQVIHDSVWSITLAEVRKELRKLNVDDQGEPEPVRHRLETELVRRHLAAKTAQMGGEG